jgi:ABC-type Fe3+-hydroxamate transport system substrate-binding protein
MKNYLLMAVLVFVLVLPMACSKGPKESAQNGAGAEQSSEYKVGFVTLNPHPTSLEDKTVVFRWNGKYNGDKFLDRVAELLTEKVPGVKVVKLWTLDKATADSSGEGPKSEKFAEIALAQKPDLVIGAQGDCGHCTPWLVIDQLNIEKKGVPTVTITTTAFTDLLKSTLEKQGVKELAFVAVEHPIAGRNAEDTKKLVDTVFPEILNRATGWQPAK